MHESLLKKKRLLESELTLKLALQLYEFAQVRGYETFGFKTMAAYCRSELHLGPSTGRYYLQIAAYIKAKGGLIHLSQWSALGPTKIRVLAALDPPDRLLVALVKRFTSSDISTRSMQAELLGGSAENRARP